MRVEIVNDGQKNATVQVSGLLLPPSAAVSSLHHVDLLQFADLNHTPSKIRVESITFAIQEKGGLYLWWTNDILLMPLESRGFFDFEKIGCLSSPIGSKGISMTTFGIDKPKAFLLILDLGKQ